MKSLSPNANLIENKYLNLLVSKPCSYTSFAKPKLAASNISSPSGVAMQVIILAPVNLAILLKSLFGTLLIPKHLESTNLLFAKSSIPLEVKITFAPLKKIMIEFILELDYLNL